MEGKADMLLANRTLSALIVVCLLVSGFAGFAMLLNPHPARAQPSGDLIVDGTYVIEDNVQPVDGDVVINTGGHLIVRDGGLTVISNAADPLQHHSITVNSGGVMTLEHSVLTTYLDQIDPYPYLTVTVNGGTIEATGDSVIKFPGSIVLTAGAELTLNDTLITSLDSAEIDQYVIKSGGGIAKDDADDSPSITSSDSTINLFDSSITKLPEYAATSKSAKNISLDGASKLLAVNSYIGIDFGPYVSSASWYTHNALVLSGSSVANLYGCTFETYVGNNADRVSAVVATGESYVALPATKGAGDTTVGQDIQALHESSESWTYHVASGLRMYIDSFSVGSPAVIDGAELIVRYMVESGYNGNQAVMWNLQGSPAASTGIVPLASQTSFVESSFDLHAAGVTTITQISTMDVSFLNGGTGGDVQFDSISVVVSIGSQVYVYRWASITVGDEYGVPIPGAGVSAVFVGSTSYGGQPSFYFGDGGASPLPPALVLNYLGKSSGTFSVTGPDGIAVVPYLTDLVSGAESPNSLFVGSFKVTGTADIGGTIYSSSSVFSFPAYPAMSASDMSTEHTVKIMGVSAVSPNPARWLVVPPSRLIEDMTYYHAGDVIVAAGGTLRFRNAEFQLVQESAYERTIYVDGTLASPAKLVFEQSTVVSDELINIMVQGDGVLIANDTTMNGVNIVALEDAQVIFHNVTMDGTITTSYDSRADLSIYDSNLYQTVTISGSAIGGFTNTSVPSVVVEDDAIAYIYRWIHVTVYDGAGYPLPGATVATRYFFNDTPASSGVSDSMGVARVSSTGTIITATGSTFVGNYKVNTSISHGADWYYADEISVGVRPYTEPLGRNATFATVTIPGALPDLVLNPDAISTYPASPMNHAMVYVNLTVGNDGVAPAHDVFADFYDTTDSGTALMGTGHVDMVPVGGTADIVFMWQAHEPLAPKEHNITVDLDPDNLVPELDETPQSAYKIVVVQNLPDVEVRSEESEIWTEPDPVVVDTVVSLRANIHNVGDATTGDVLVEFYDEPSGQARTLIGTYIVTAIPKDGLAVAMVPWTPDISGSHTIYVLVNGGVSGTHSFVEPMYTNNEASNVVSVLTPPDLVLGGLTFVPAGSVPGGDVLTVRASLTNTQLAPVTHTILALYIDSPVGTPVKTQDVYVTLVNGGTTTVEVTYPTSVVTSTVDVTFYLVVNPNHDMPEELTYANNVQSGTITVRDMRPDLVLTPSAITVKSAATGDPISGATFGKTVIVEVAVSNEGGSTAVNFTVAIGVRNETTAYNHTFRMDANNYSATAGGTTNVTYQWRIELTDWGWYDIWAWADSDAEISEPNDGNNFASILFEVTPLKVDVYISTGDKTEFTAGDMIYLTVTIVYQNTNDRVPLVQDVIFMLEDSNNVVVPNSETGGIDAKEDGTITETLVIPSTLDSGSYEIVAEVYGTTYPAASPVIVQITAIGGEGLFPMWVWYLIIIVVVAAVAGFTLYTYKYGLGKYVECGECGAFIPAASKRCPKCGVEFEAGTMKCSECGAWIPAESTECPNCGVKFVGEAEEEADYLDRMRAEYDEMVSKYRELARPELGKKFTDREFEIWWKGQPGYITFDDWLAKEEEKKKEGPIPCPVCGTLNPKEATVCHKCGTVFGAAKAAPPPEKKAPPPAAPPAAGAPPAGTTEAAMPGAPQRMVIRRPIEKKVVPKKIIRTPSGQVIEEEPKEGENNQ